MADLHQMQTVHVSIICVCLQTTVILATMVLFSVLWDNTGYFVVVLETRVQLYF